MWKKPFPKLIKFNTAIHTGSMQPGATASVPKVAFVPPAESAASGLSAEIIQVLKNASGATNAIKALPVPQQAPSKVGNALAGALGFLGPSEAELNWSKLTGEIPWALSQRDLQMSEIALDKAAKLKIRLPLLEAKNKLSMQQKIALSRLAAGLGELLTSDPNKRTDPAFLAMFTRVMVTAFGSPNGLRELQDRYVKNANTSSPPPTTARQSTAGYKLGQVGTQEGQATQAKASASTTPSSSAPIAISTPQQQSHANRLANEFAAGIISGNAKWDQERLLAGDLPGLYEAGKKKVLEAALPEPLATYCLDTLTVAIYNKLIHAVLDDKVDNKRAIPVERVRGIIEGIRAIHLRFSGSVSLFGIPMDDAGFTTLAQRLWKDAIDGRISAARQRSPFKAVVFDRSGVPQPVMRVENNGPGISIPGGGGAPNRSYIATLTLYTQDGSAWIGFGNPQAKPPRVYPIPANRLDLLPPGGNTRDTRWIQRLRNYVLAQRKSGAVAEAAFVPLPGQSPRSSGNLPQQGGQPQPLQKPAINPTGGSDSAAAAAEKYGVSEGNVRRVMQATGMTPEQAAAFLAAQVLGAGWRNNPSGGSTGQSDPVGGSDGTASEDELEKTNAAILDQIRTASTETLNKWLAEVEFSELPPLIQQAIRQNKAFGYVIDKGIRNILRTAAPALEPANPPDESIPTNIESFSVEAHSTIRFVPSGTVDSTSANVDGKFYGEITLTNNGRTFVTHGLTHQFDFYLPGHDMAHVVTGLGIEAKIAAVGSNIEELNDPFIEAELFGLAEALRALPEFAKTVTAKLPIVDELWGDLTKGKSDLDERQMATKLKVNAVTVITDFFNRTGYNTFMGNIEPNTPYMNQIRDFVENGTNELVADPSKPNVYLYEVPQNIVTTFKLVFQNLLSTNPRFKEEIIQNCRRYIDFVGKAKLMMQDKETTPRQISTELALSGESTKAMHQELIRGLKALKRLYPGMQSIDGLIRYSEFILQQGESSDRHSESNQRKN
ncbi:hypothetical protein SAMN06265795_101294 [Noviherbaspirillum humi]|uniref:Uncharacterized protein n=1 Tax=Noviherbaspirillum humi TaxID=1688639 RepID=A0A239C6T0_9BURK|nr:hypothetical protein [Noviherbaspirillum humi]SNS15937.1 hypothetical protein SAMN06265795_101294 [Noviherbaspirillum humi]